MSYFQSNLKYLRNESNLSQQQVADGLGIKQRTYGNYEIGHSEPSLEMLLKISKFFRTSLDMLVGVALFDKEDREIAQSLNIGNTDFLIRTVKQGGDIAIKKALKKEPNIFDPEIVKAIKEQEIKKEQG